MMCKMNWLVQMQDIVLCRIYRKATSQKWMDKRATPNPVGKEEAVAAGDKYEKKSHAYHNPHDRYATPV